jgi:hypothetical protein
VIAKIVLGINLRPAVSLNVLLTDVSYASWITSLGTWEIRIGSCVQLVASWITSLGTYEIRIGSSVQLVASCQKDSVVKLFGVELLGLCK